MMFLWAAFTLGLLGSLHCIGMCGPIALALPVTNRSIWGRLMSAMSYNLGRMVTYAVMGTICGSLGFGLALATSQSVLSLVSGGLILAFVIAGWLGLGSGHSFVYRAIEPVRRRLRGLFATQSLAGLFLIGLLNGFLPCGLVYVAIGGALATGNAMHGALFMALFGAGTAPAMTLIVYIREAITLQFRNRVRQFVPVFACVVACLLLVRGMNLGVPWVSPAVNADKGVHECCRAATTANAATHPASN